MEKETKKKDFRYFFIISRYLVLLLLMFSSTIIYLIFTPLTVYPVYTTLRLIYGNVTLAYPITAIDNLININNYSMIEIAPACIAGAAYLLLLVLNLSIKMPLKKRVQSLVLSFIILLILNILRIILFSIIYHNRWQFFDITHKIFWYVISTLFVVGIWFLIVKIFSIRQIPFVSDIQTIYKQMSIKK